MKKKIVLIVVVVLIISFIGGAIFFLTDGRLKHYQMNKERINNCTTLSKYIEYHDIYYMTVANNNNSAEYSLYFDAKDIKCELLNEKGILYYQDTRIDMEKGLLILDDNTLYETAFNSEQVYSNGQQYKKIDTGVEIKQVKILLGSPYFISTDNKYYEIQNRELKEITKSNMGDYLYTKYTSLLNDDSIKKVISHNIDNIIVIKDDGQVYEQAYKCNLNTSPYTYDLISETLLLSNKEYGNITDCVYSQYDTDKSGITRIVSDKGLFYLKQTNDQQYIDTDATYELVASDIYNKYKADIKHIDGTYIFTTDNNIIRTDMLCRDIDKEVK